MKTIRLFLLVSLISVLGYSQTEYKLDSLYQYSWNMAIPDWSHDVTEKNTFANGGANETHVLGLMNNGAIFVNSYQKIKTYYPNGNIATETQQTWDGTMFIDASRKLYEYNGSDLIAKETNEFYNGTTWQVFDETTYTYNGSGDLEVETYKEYSFFTMMLENISQELYVYTGMLATEHTTQVWNVGTMSWQNEEKADITYTDGLPTHALYSLWNQTLMVYDPPYEQDFGTYDTSDNLIEILSQEFVMGGWVNTDRSIISYLGGLISEFLEQSWDGVDWINAARETKDYDANANNIQIVFEDWDEIGGEWVGNFKQDRFFSPADALGVESFAELNAKIFPNPVSDVFQVVLKTPVSVTTEVNMYSLDGKLVKQMVLQPGQETMRINIEELQQGFFILRIKGQAIQVFRIVKK